MKPFASPTVAAASVLAIAMSVSADSSKSTAVHKKAGADSQGRVALF